MIILLGLFDCWGRIVKNTTDWRVDAESRVEDWIWVSASCRVGGRAAKAKASASPPY